MCHVLGAGCVTTITSKPVFLKDNINFILKAHDMVTGNAVVIQWDYLRTGCHASSLNGPHLTGCYSRMCVRVTLP